MIGLAQTIVLGRRKGAAVDSGHHQLKIIVGCIRSADDRVWHARYAFSKVPCTKSRCLRSRAAEELEAP